MIEIDVVVVELEVFPEAMTELDVTGRGPGWRGESMDGHGCSHDSGVTIKTGWEEVLGSGHSLFICILCTCTGGS